MADHLLPPTSLFLEFCFYTAPNVHFCTFIRYSREREVQISHIPPLQSSFFSFMLLLLFPEREIFCSFLSKFMSSISVWANGAFAKTERKANPQTVHSASRSPSMPAYEARTHENRCQVESCRAVSCYLVPCLYKHRWLREFMCDLSIIFDRRWVGWQLSRVGFRLRRRGYCSLFSLTILVPSVDINYFAFRSTYCPGVFRSHHDG
ncbi:hypothetical protein M6B38_130400 [Iris pallida]|uniref:Uncharacterized protein n=1 Tax=Iris pallida TaxID=29817 RepID=A0AAX6FZT4_IRIPA|nr:hypothetical protein M6B38_130400 [Iris pallida]